MENISATELKDQGNRLFQCHRFEEAVSCYNKAIIKNPEVPTFFTNRALCYLHLKQVNRAADDCRKALELDRRLVKAHFFLGKALLTQDNFDEAVKSLTRAYELSKTQKLNFGDEITQALREARRKKFQKEEEIRICQEVSLHSYLNKLIADDQEKKLRNLNIKFRLQNCDDPSSEKLDTINRECAAYTEQLALLFEQIDDRRKKRDVPDYLCGRISFELMKDPVITPSGITYDRKDITEHLQRVGHFDPVTRSSLTAEQLIPNLAMAEVIENFLKENEWACDY